MTTATTEIFSQSASRPTDRNERLRSPRCCRRRTVSNSSPLCSLAFLVLLALSIVPRAWIEDHFGAWHRTSNGYYSSVFFAAAEDAANDDANNNSNNIAEGGQDDALVEFQGDLDFDAISIMPVSCVN